MHVVGCYGRRYKCAEFYSSLSNYSKISDKCQKIEHIQKAFGFAVKFEI